MSRSPLPGGNRPLDELKPTLPREFYVDADHHRRELEVFWYSRWICVGRTEGLTDSGQYQCVSIGDQEIVVVRNTAALERIPQHLPSSRFHSVRGEKRPL